MTQATHSDAAVMGLLDFIDRTPIGWIVTAGEYEKWLPLTPHGNHRYDGGCAVCRCGDDERALKSLLEALAASVAMSALAQACPVCGGRGWMELGFFTGMTMGTSTAPESCRPCRGSGLIWRGEGG